MKTMKSRQ